MNGSSDRNHAGIQTAVSECKPAICSLAFRLFLVCAVAYCTFMLCTGGPKSVGGVHKWRNPRPSPWNSKPAAHPVLQSRPAPSKHVPAGAPAKPIQPGPTASAKSPLPNAQTVVATSKKNVPAVPSTSVKSTHPSAPTVAAAAKKSIPPVTSAGKVPASRCPCIAECSILEKISAAAKATKCRKNGDSVPLDANPAFPMTLVTSFFHIPSKRPASTYLPWLRFFLHRIRTPIAFFVDCQSVKTRHELVDIFRQREKMFPGRLHTDIMELEQTPLTRQFGAVLKRQESRDHERHLGHNYLLYLVWQAKTEALMQAIRTNYFCSEWFLWVDAGAFRSPHNLVNWPSVERLKTLPKNRTFMELVFGFPNMEALTDVDPKANMDNWLSAHRPLIYGNHLAGGFIGLNIRHDAHKNFYNGLVATYKLLADRDYMIVKDQVAYNTLFLMHPHNFSAVRSKFACSDGWFEVEPFLADPKEWPCSNPSQLLVL